MKATDTTESRRQQHMATIPRLLRRELCDMYSAKSCSEARSFVIDSFMHSPDPATRSPSNSMLFAVCA